MILGFFRFDVVTKENIKEYLILIFRLETVVSSDCFNLSLLCLSYRYYLISCFKSTKDGSFAMCLRA